MTTIIVSFTAERYVVEECRTSRPKYTLNRRAVKFHQLRQELLALARQFKAATEEEKLSLAELHHSITKKLMTLHRAE